MSPTPWQRADHGNRKMVAYNMSEQDANDVIAFLKWIGKIDLNGFETVVSPLAKNKN